MLHHSITNFAPKNLETLTLNPPAARSIATKAVMKKIILILLALAIPAAYIAYKIPHKKQQGITMDQLQKNMDARAKNYDDFSSGKITYAESQRRDAKLRLDDSSISDSERLAGIEYQLTLLRIATEERAR